MAIGTDLVTHQIPHVFCRNENIKGKGVLQQIGNIFQVIDPPTSAIDGKKNLGTLSVRMRTIVPKPLTISGTWAHKATNNQIKPCRDIRSAYL